MLLPTGLGSPANFAYLFIQILHKVSNNGGVAYQKADVVGALR